MSKARLARDWTWRSRDLSYLNSTQTWNRPSASRSRSRTSARSTPGCCRATPLTLIDTGPCDDAALDALEAGLRRAGVRLEDLELVLVTHHHLDHSGLAATIAARSGARIAAYERAAAYGAHYEERGEADRRFSLALMRHHGVPEPCIADTEAFWEFLRRESDAYDADVVLADGETIRAGGRDLRVVAAPRAQHHRRAAGRRARADRVRRRPPARQDLLQHRDLPGARADRLAPPRARRVPREPAADGGDAARPPAHRARRRHHRPRRARRAGGSPSTSAAATGSSPRSRPAAPPRTRSPPTCGPSRRSLEQPLLVVWEVLGHLDLLLDAGRVQRAGDRRRQHLRRRVLRARRHTTTPTRRWTLCTSQPRP